MSAGSSDMHPFSLSFFNLSKLLKPTEGLQEEGFIVGILLTATAVKVLRRERLWRCDSSPDVARMYACTHAHVCTT